MADPTASSSVTGSPDTSGRVDTSEWATARHVHSGKVRELYELADGRLLMVASDRISAYDWVLRTPIPDKGRILTQLSLWWFERLADLLPNHVLSTDLPAGAPPEFAGRAVCCRPLSMVKVECVARGYLAGSGLAEYAESGTVCGISLPPGLVDGSEMPKPIFTPTTKAPLGEHDAPMTFDQVVEQEGHDRAEELRRITLEIYARGHRIAAERGVLIADTKVELGSDENGRLVLADEVLTPDSSRFWPADGWEPGRRQHAFDKQFVRDWLTSPASGWSSESGAEPPELPVEIVERTRQRYVDAYERLTGRRFT